MRGGFFPGWTQGYVKEYLDSMERDGQRKKAAAKVLFDMQMVLQTWPRPTFVTVRPLKGHEPLWELKRLYQGIQYRVFFCVRKDEVWWLHMIEKKETKTPLSDLRVAAERMGTVLAK